MRDRAHQGFDLLLDFIVGDGEKEIVHSKRDDAMDGGKHHARSKSLKTEKYVGSFSFQAAQLIGHHCVPSPSGNLGQSIMRFLQTLAVIRRQVIAVVAQ